MRLKDININEQFQFVNYGKLTWIKKTEQGMNNAFSYCETTTKHKRRNTHKSITHKLFNQKEEVIKIE